MSSYQCNCSQKCSEFRKEFCKMSLEGGSGGICSPTEPREGVTTPSPEHSVRGMTYANSYGADTLGERRISPPGPPLLFSVILGEAKFLLPQTPTSLKMSRISSKRWETYSHPKFQLLKSEFRKEFWNMSLEGGSGGTCSPTEPREGALPPPPV